MSTEDRKAQWASQTPEQRHARRDVEWPAARPTRANSVWQAKVSGALLLGWLLILGGLAGMGYFFFVFNVGAPGTDVVNLGLMTRVWSALSFPVFVFWRGCCA